MLRAPNLTTLIYVVFISLSACTAQLRADDVGLVGRWTFSEGTGATTTDSSGNGNTGTIQGAYWYVGRYGGGLYCDGAGCARVADAPSLRITGDLTIAAWVRLADPTKDAYERIVSKKIAWDDAAGYDLEYNPARKMLILLGGGSDTASASVDLGAAWHHVIATVAGTTATFFVDGVAVPMTDDTVGSIIAGNSDLCIGRNAGGGGQYDGAIDDVEIYARSMHAPEAAIEASAPAPGALASWRFDEPSGTTAVDDVGGHDGALEGPTRASSAGRAYLSFDGASDVLIAQAPSLDTRFGYTISAWVRIADPSDVRWMYVIGWKSAWDSSDGVSIAYHCGLKRLAFLTSGGDGAIADVDLNAGWHSVVAQLDGSNAALFVDGQQQGASQRVPVASTTTAPLLIGSGPNHLQGWHGDIDAVQVFGRALTASDIVSIATPRSASAPASLTAVRVDSRDVSLRWTPASGSDASLFQLMQDGAPVLAAVTPSAVVHGLEPSTTYSFAVAAVGADGSLSPYTAPLSVKTQDEAPDPTQLQPVVVTLGLYEAAEDEDLSGTVPLYFCNQRGISFSIHAQLNAAVTLTAIGLDTPFGTLNGAAPTFYPASEGTHRVVPWVTYLDASGSHRAVGAPADVLADYTPPEVSVEIDPQLRANPDVPEPLPSGGDPDAPFVSLNDNAEDGAWGNRALRQLLGKQWYNASAFSAVFTVVDSSGFRNDPMSPGSWTFGADVNSGLSVTVTQIERPDEHTVVLHVLGANAVGAAADGYVSSIGDYWPHVRDRSGNYPTHGLRALRVGRALTPVAGWQAVAQATLPVRFLHTSFPLAALWAGATTNTLTRALESSPSDWVLNPPVMLSQINGATFPLPVRAIDFGGNVYSDTFQIQLAYQLYSTTNAWVSGPISNPLNYDVGPIAGSNFLPLGTAPGIWLWQSTPQQTIALGKLPSNAVPSGASYPPTIVNPVAPVDVAGTREFSPAVISYPSSWSSLPQLVTARVKSPGIAQVSAGSFDLQTCGPTTTSGTKLTFSTQQSTVAAHSWLGDQLDEMFTQVPLDRLFPQLLPTAGLSAMGYARVDFQATPANASGFVGFSGTGHRWTNIVAVRPDVVVTGGPNEVQIAAMFFDETQGVSSFSSTGDYVRFVDAAGNDVTGVSGVATDAETARGQIAIQSQRLVQEDVGPVQRLVLSVTVGDRVPAGFYHVDIALGNVHAYPEQPSAPFTGLGGRHRVASGLCVVVRAVDLIYRDAAGVARIVNGQVEADCPAPGVTVAIGSAHIDANGHLIVGLTATVTDSVSETSATPTTALLIHGGPEDLSVPVSYGAGSPPWTDRSLPSSFPVTYDLGVVNAGPMVVTASWTDPHGTEGHDCWSIPIGLQAAADLYPADAGELTGSEHIQLTFDGAASTVGVAFVTSVASHEWGVLAWNGSEYAGFLSSGTGGSRATFRLDRSQIGAPQISGSLSLAWDSGDTQAFAVTAQRGGFSYTGPLDVGVSGQLQIGDKVYLPTVGEPIHCEQTPAASQRSYLVRIRYANPLHPTDPPQVSMDGKQLKTAPLTLDIQPVPEE